MPSPGALPKSASVIIETQQQKGLKGSNCCHFLSPILCLPLCWPLSVTSLRSYNSLKKNVVFNPDQDTWLHKDQISFSLCPPCLPHVSTHKLHLIKVFKLSALQPRYILLPFLSEVPFVWISSYLISVDFKEWSSPLCIGTCPLCLPY